MQVQIIADIDDAVIANMMVSFVESGDPVTRGWCAGVKLLGAPLLPGRIESPWYADKRLYLESFEIEVKELLDESKPATGDNVKKHAVTRETMVAGLQVMAKEFPDAFHQILGDNTDAPCADIFMQCVLFGGEKYA